MNNLNEKVEFKQVTLIEKDFTILNNVSFSLNDHKIIGLIGRNGAGKTSLLSLLASYRLPTNGQVLIDGDEAFENEEKMEQVIFIYPSDFTEETDTVEDFLYLFSRYYSKYDSEYASYLIDRFKLPLDKAVSELSKGMQSALNVITGLASKAPITIFDEAYLSMDAPSRELFYEELQGSQMNHPRLFILSTHIISEAEYLFDEVFILEKGKLLFHEDYETLISKGVTVTGSKEEVEILTAPYKIINEEKLGSVKAVTIFGEGIETLQEEARVTDVELKPVSLQQLFSHLTKESEENE